MWNGSADELLTHLPATRITRLGNFELGRCVLLARRQSAFYRAAGKIAKGNAIMDTFLLDLKYGVRSLWRDKGFALTVLLTFAVCIAANAALFAIVNSVILRPLPVADANSIVITSNDYPKAGITGGNISAAGDYYDRLREMTVFESQALFHDRNQTSVEINGAPQQIRGMLVTPSWFHLLRVSPMMGRPFAEEEGEEGH